MNDSNTVKENPMREIRIDKVVVNIGCGEAGDKLDRCKKLLVNLLNKKITTTKTTGRTTFGMGGGRPIGVKTILRGKDAEAFLKRAFDGIENKLKKQIFDTQGNFSFGIKEHIAIPGVKYDPEIGIYGMDVCVTLERKGFRVMRKRRPAKVAITHRIKPDEAKEWVIKKFGVKVE
jgi:large subunit ribosomal protein L5